MEVFTRVHRWYTVLPLTGILVYLLTLTGYWQAILAAGLLAGILMKKPWPAFGASMIGGGLAWGIPLVVASMTYPMNAASALLLKILGLSPSLYVVTYALTILLGAVVTGLGALIGGFTSRLWVRGEVEEARTSPP